MLYLVKSLRYFAMDWGCVKLAYELRKQGGVPGGVVGGENEEGEGNFIV